MTKSDRFVCILLTSPVLGAVGAEYTTYLFNERGLLDGFLGWFGPVLCAGVLGIIPTLGLVGLLTFWTRREPEWPGTFRLSKHQVRMIMLYGVGISLLCYAMEAHGLWHNYRLIVGHLRSMGGYDDCLPYHHKRLMLELGAALIPAAFSFAIPVWISCRLFLPRRSA